MNRVFHALALAVLLAIWAGGVVVAQQTSFVWDRFDVEIWLRPDGTFDVVETQTIAVDGTLRRGYREIRLDRVGGITEISVAEPDRPYVRGSGQPYTFSASRGDGIIRIDWWFPPTTDTTRTFLIRYRVDDAIRVYEGGDQLYWTAVGPDLVAPVRSSTVTVRFPSDVPPDDLKLAAYPDRLAETPRQSDPRTATFQATDIPVGEAFTVRAQFPHGLVQADVPTWQQQADLADWYESNARPVLNLGMLLLTLAIVGIGGALLAGLWFVRGSDPRVGRIAATIEEPPSDLPPALVGTLVDEHADVQDVVAILVDLANRGIIRITEERNPSLVGSDRDYRLTLERTDTVGLRPYEKTVISTLFPAEQRVVQLSDLKDRFRAAIPLFQDQLHAEVVGERLFVANPDQVRRRYRTVGGILLAVGLLGGLFALLILAQWVELSPLPFVALVGLGIVLWWLAKAMPRRTRNGAIEAARWRAFARFLASGGGRSKRRSREAVEEWMPYAVALGADQTWVRNLESVGTPPPRWYGRAAGPLDGGPYGGPPIVVLPGPGGGFGGDWGSGPARAEAPTATTAEPGGGSGPSGDLQGWSDSLADMLNRSSDVLSSGGGGDWSGGGLGDVGGSFGSGGGGGGFE